MKEDFKETIRILWEVHRGKLCGTVLGLLIGAGIVCFGFWKTFLFSAAELLVCSSGLRWIGASLLPDPLLTVSQT